MYIQVKKCCEILQFLSELIFSLFLYIHKIKLNLLKREIIKTHHDIVNSFVITIFS